MGKIDEITGNVIGAAMEVHSTLGPGFLEAVYHKALSHEMTLRGLSFDEKKKLSVTYKTISAGDFEYDFLVEEEVLIEIKAVENLGKSHHVQTVNYLAATRKDIGLLLNFGNTSLEYHRKYRTGKNQSS